MSFREFMREPQKATAVSACKHCGKPIERRGQLWYATRESVGSDICIKAPRGSHVPAKGSR